MKCFLACLLLVVAPSLRAESECAQLLASSFQGRELSTDQKFRAYMEDLLEGGEMGFEQLADFSRNLNEGVLANPVTEDVALRNYELEVHRSLLQEYVDSGELDIEEIGKWALARLEKMGGDRSKQEGVSEEIKEIANIDVTSRAFWKQVTDRYLKYIPIGEKISGAGGMKAIHFAVRHAPLETLKKFIDIHQKDLNIDAEDEHGKTPLIFAVDSRNSDVVSTLVNAGADANAKDDNGWSPLIYTAWRGNPDSANALVKVGADANAQDNDGWTPLMYAARSGNLDVVSALVNAGAEVNAQDNDGWTPLMYAASKGNLDVASALVNAGAEVNAQDNDGWTPLMYAASKGNLDVASALVNAGAEVNAQDNNGWTPLMYAVRNGTPDIVNALVNARADVNARDYYGKTPLMWAARSGNPDAVNALVKAGADVNAQDNDGWTPLMFADRSGNVDTVNALNLNSELNVRKK